ncbi:MAG: RNA polymerase factor sigma-54 [Muribaculaceae bacterium]|nr:RNA polymerase factor sigma-54 [Muribaculaceae bacterium]
MQEKLSLSTQQKLQQRLSPLQVQFVHLLEMNRVEIEEEVRHEIDENPAIDVADTGVAESTTNNDEHGDAFTESAEDIQRADYKDEEDIPYYRLNVSNASADDDTPESVIVAEGSIIDYLEEQLAERELSEREHDIATYIIGNIDDNGYLQRGVGAIADDIVFQTGLDVTNCEVEEVLQIVRDLEPAGVGALDLRDCLLLQLERKGANEISMLAYRVIDEYFDEFSKKHYEKIVSALGVSEDRLKDILKEIRTLNPKPGSTIIGSTSDSHSQQIIPDFSVEIDGESLQLTLLNNIPELQIEENFAIMYDTMTNAKKLSRKEEEASTFVKQKYESASGFIKILRQRQETLFGTMRAIVNRQREFFLSGDEARLKPMVLKDIAEITNHDLSVISRATTNKYVITQWGIFPLKFFFNEGLQHESGEEVSSREIQSILKKVIEEENKKRPYSDKQLCEILCKNGYEIARRTVAKYREKLAIPVARLRKEL